VKPQPTLYGAAYSVYVRIVRLTLLEKGVDYTYIPVDVFSDSGVTAPYIERNPFGKIPSFSHNGIDLYETSAITRYIDEAFTTPPLMPVELEQRARANQIISIIDNYGYPAMVWGIYVPSTESSNEVEDHPDHVKSIETSQIVLDTLDQFADNDGSFLVSNDITLADLYALAVLHYFMQTDTGQTMAKSNKKLLNWYQNTMK